MMLRPRITSRAFLLRSAVSVATAAPFIRGSMMLFSSTTMLVDPVYVRLVLDLAVQLGAIGGGEVINSASLEYRVEYGHTLAVRHRARCTNRARDTHTRQELVRTQLCQDDRDIGIADIFRKPLLDDFSDFAGRVAAGFDITDDRHRDLSVGPHRCGHRQLRVAPHGDLHSIVYADTITPFDAGEQLSRIISGLRDPRHILATGHDECRHKRTNPAPPFHLTPRGTLLALGFVACPDKVDN